MESINYYEILGVSEKASLAEITSAKNQLAKKYHPDVNMKNGIDTTEQMQQILEAYRVLSNPKKRAKYDRENVGHKAVMQTFDLHNMDETEENGDSGFVVYWKAATALYDIILESDLIFKAKERTSRLTQLSTHALKHILLLRQASIPERYWHPDIMNWLLFTWYKNRNVTIDYLLTQYDEYIKKSMSGIDRLKLQKETHHFQHSLKRLLKY
ncbi:MAG: DnaJ domain-containing protein [Dorea sp.]|nr:DnaJ domain-containing protein [Dorea sp.]